MQTEARRSRVALVTGGSSGIGLATARGLGSEFDVVGIIGRSPARLEAAAEALEATPARIEIFRADFSSVVEVRQLVSEVKSRFSSLSVLINNAGVWHKERTLSKDGYENTFAVNHLAHFVLTTELRGLLTRGAPSRVLHVSSSMHRRPPELQWDDLMFEKRWRGLAAYSQSKLANVLFSNELARRWKELDITSNALNPGNVRSRIMRNNKLLHVLLRSPLARLVVLSEEEGARASVHLATAPELRGVSGQYFERLKRAEPSPAARDEAAAHRLWEVSERLAEAASARLR